MNGTSPEAAQTLSSLLVTLDGLPEWDVDRITAHLQSGEIAAAARHLFVQAYEYDIEPTDADRALLLSLASQLGLVRHYWFFLEETAGAA